MIQAAVQMVWVIPETAFVLGTCVLFPHPDFVWFKIDRYNHYVELIEPSQKRACIRCCQDFDDCRLDKGEAYSC